MSFIQLNELGSVLVYETLLDTCLDLREHIRKVQFSEAEITVVDKKAIIMCFQILAR